MRFIFKTSFLIFAGLINHVQALESISIPIGQYETTARILLPHLEQNLKNTTVKQVRCLDELEIGTLFPILQYPTFNGCKLLFIENQENVFDLSCDNDHAASGLATFAIGPDRFSADLNIKMGAKNMTLMQRITASKISDCTAVD